MPSQPIAQNLADPMLLAEVEDLRARFPETQALYREVCALLFFRHGITPTANKLYQLVRKGSMSAPAEALLRFWENLRVKSRIRIEHPDLPAELAETAGGLLGNLWQRAQEAAEESYRAAREESRAALAQAESQAQASEARAEAAAQALFQLQAEFSANLTRFQELEQALEHERARAAGLDGRLAAAQAQLQATNAALADARRAMEQLRTDHQEQQRQADTRHRRDLEQAQGEVQGARAAAQEWQRALQQVRDDARDQAQRAAAEAQRYREEISSMRTAATTAQAQLAEARAARELLRHQLDRARLAGRAMPTRRGRIQGRA